MTKEIKIQICCEIFSHIHAHHSRNLYDQKILENFIKLYIRYKSYVATDIKELLNLNILPCFIGH